jgi:hypothetical protein
MEQRSQVTRLYRFTNAHNEVVRKEAQAAIVQLYGFEGLRFLDVIDTPLSEWQQIQLLRLLQQGTGIPGEKVSRWLRSSNETVRMFTLKLIADQHLQETLPLVMECLRDHREGVRLQAIRCLRDLGTSDSCRALIDRYSAEGPRVRLSILNALGHIGMEAEVDFLGGQLSAASDSIKLEATRALVRIGDAGLRRLQQFPLIDESPWHEMIRQAKSERAV